MKRYFPVVFLILLFACSSSGQTKLIRGKVICFNEIPVAGVEISSKKGKDNCLTDSLGNFEISVRAKRDKLRLRARGFESMNYYTSDEDSLVLNMVFKESRKNKKMVTAYGYISQKDLTYALANLNDENTRFSNYQDIFDILSTFAGVRVNKSVSPPEVNIRGSVSILAGTEPLFVVDGLATDASFIADIRPEDVKEISVLKDSGAAIYGTRGANGVIIIRLK